MWEKTNFSIINFLNSEFKLIAYWEILGFNGVFSCNVTYYAEKLMFHDQPVFFRKKIKYLAKCSCVYHRPTQSNFTYDNPTIQTSVKHLEMTIQKMHD